MKLSSIFTIFAVASADEERKVPPRTPDQRLRTLHRFVTNWIDSQRSLADDFFLHSGIPSGCFYRGFRM